MFTVEVPATSANLGAGYDLIGVALTRANRFQGRLSDRLSIALTGPFAGPANFALDETNLVWQAMQRVSQRSGRKLPGAHLLLETHIPPSRGLGSSSTALVGGLWLGNALLDSPFSPEELLAMAIDLEGHPDNVAPAALGGCVLNLKQGNRYTQVQLPIPRDLKWVVCYPDFELSTRKAREVVPLRFKRDDCIRNTGYFGALIAGLYSGDRDLLRHGLQDCLHQPYRAPLIPGMEAVMAAAIRAGAIGCVLSGAGPSLLALTDQAPEAVAEAMQTAWNHLSIRSDYVIANIDPQGARIL